MELTTGLILRRIMQTDLSVSAHKLATVILDGIAWKDGYNGLSRGTAAFTLLALAEKMGVSRQYLNVLLSELEASGLQLKREKVHGKFAPWLFRFAVFDDIHELDSEVSQGDDTSLSKRNYNKNVFSGRIAILDGVGVFQTRWAAVIKRAKAILPCWNVDTQLIWDRFVAFNRARGNKTVPAGFLLGFMRRWRTLQGSSSAPATPPIAQSVSSPRERQLYDQIKLAPTVNRHFHASDLCRAIGQAAYEARVIEVIRRCECPRFTATLAVHGQAVLAGEIAP